MNPVLRHLGFGPTDRAVIVHADDVGMCQASLPAFAELMNFGLLTSGSVMVPCPWFPAVAEWYGRNPHTDIGVHLTLTSEWSAYRWGPVSTRHADSGLLDTDGYFPATISHLWRQACVETVRTEAQAQIAQAQHAGIELSHMDCHMYAALEPHFLPTYVAMAFQHQLPILLPRSWPMHPPGLRRQIAEWEEHGLPIFDTVSVATSDTGLSQPIAGFQTLFDSLPPGLSCILVHPAQDTPELRAILPDWQARTTDYQTLLSPVLRTYVCESGIHLLSYHSVQQVMQARLAQQQHIEPPCRQNNLQDNPQNILSTE